MKIQPCCGNCVFSKLVFSLVNVVLCKADNYPEEYHKASDNYCEFWEGNDEFEEEIIGAIDELDDLCSDLEESIDNITNNISILFQNLSDYINDISNFSGEYNIVNRIVDVQSIIEDNIFKLKQQVKIFDECCEIIENKEY